MNLRALLIAILILVPNVLLADPAPLTGFAALSPAAMWRQLSTNLANHQYIATDLTVHSTRWAALQRLFAPVDVGANVHAAWLSQLNPLALAGNVLFPVVYRVTKMLAGEHP